jgi:hypothetical protein
MSAAFCPLEIARKPLVFAWSSQKQVIDPSFSKKTAIPGPFIGGHASSLLTIMKTKKLMVLALSISALAALPSMAGVGVGIQINVPAPVVVAPAPVVTVQAVPESYVYDGVEYVGVVGTQYYYLGPGNVWLTLDGPRVTRFHEWEHGHADWRTHAIRNERFRHDEHGHEAPSHDKKDGHDNHDSHSSDHGHDNDHH